MPAILTNHQLRSYKENGYLLIPNVFSAPDISSIRKIFLQAFEEELWAQAPYSNQTIINNIFYYFPELIHQLITPLFITIIKDIAGEQAVWIPECSVHRNRYIHWHKDTSIQELNGEVSHKDTQCPLIQAAIYFQPNDDELGGGVTVIKGSHLRADNYYKMLSSSLTTKAYYKLLKILKVSAFDKMERSGDKVDIPSQPGDLVLFDVRLNHRATKPMNTVANTPLDKLAIFNTFGNNSHVTKKYFSFMKNRPEPYYRYFREHPLPEVVYKKAKELNVDVLY